MRTERIIIYSALFGAYDASILNVDQISALDTHLKKFKFVLFTNQKRLKSDLWEVVYVDSDPIKGDNPRSSYYYKTLPHKVLPKHGFDNETSVWIDSSINRLKLDKLYDMCVKFKASGKSLFIERHPGRDCVYDELDACIRLSKDDPEAMRRHVQSYKDEGYPAHNGMVETGAQIRNHYNPDLIKFQDALWNEILTKTRRDQLSWNYVSWKLNFKDYDLFTFKEKTDFLWFCDHPHRVTHKEKVLLAGPWLGDEGMEPSWSSHIRKLVQSTPYDSVVIGCRPNREHLYDDYADKFIISNPVGEVSRNLLNGKVPRFNVKISEDKDVIQLNPNNDICGKFKMYDRSKSKIHLLWATIRPDMFKETVKSWYANMDKKDDVVLYVGVDTEDQKSQLCDFDNVSVIESKRKGVTYPSYVLSSKIANNTNISDNDIVVFASDDFFPMEHWDTALKNEFDIFEGAILVNDQYGAQNKSIMSIPILTVGTLRKLNGIIYHPDYKHCWSDNELYDNLKELNLLNDISTSKPEVYFEHRHFSNGKREIDDIDKDHQLTNADDMVMYRERKKLTLKQKLEVKRVISFSLWGDHPKYTLGAIENVKIQRQIYPNWVCRFYYDSSVPVAIIDELKSMGAELVYKEIPSVGSNGLAWRFEVGFDPTVDRFIIRDTDSRLNLKEVYAVNDWMESGEPFHIMRDHANHGVPILGGMWGAVKGFVGNYKELYDTWIENMTATNHSRDTYFNFDQIFLWNIIWPLIKNKCIAHDERFKFTDKEKPFIYNLDNDLFVGQSYDENNEPIFDY